MINRSALILRYKQPFVDWINAVDPAPSTPAITLEDTNGERTIYLVEFDEKAELEGWLELNHELLFEEELFGWYTDPKLWPKDRSLRKLKEWCDVELHTVVIDTGESLIVEED